jgi:hypothetical protein
MIRIHAQNKVTDWKDTMSERVRLPRLKLKAHELTIAVGQAARRAAQKTVSVAFWSVPYYSRWGLYPQAVFVVVILVWFEYRPEWAIQGPGIAMGFLAIAAIFMAVRGSDSTRIEGAVWIAISFCLFAGEMHFIAVDRKEHDAEQAELRSREEKTRREQTQSFGRLIGDGKLLFSALAEEKALTTKNLEHLTGGDEYCWVVPVDPKPAGLGGDPAHQGNNYYQLGLKNSGNVALPTCDIRFMPFPTDKERREGVLATPPFLFYHFEKVPVVGRRYYRYTPYFIKGDRTYSGVIETPTRTFNEVIEFEPDPNDPRGYIPKCTVASPSGKMLEKDCNPQ